MADTLRALGGSAPSQAVAAWREPFAVRERLRKNRSAGAAADPFESGGFARLTRHLEHLKAARDSNGTDGSLDAESNHRRRRLGHSHVARPLFSTTPKQHRVSDAASPLVRRAHALSQSQTLHWRVQAREHLLLGDMVRRASPSSYTRRAPPLRARGGGGAHVGGARAGGGGAWYAGLTLPEYVLDTSAPSDLSLNRYMANTDSERAPLLPSLFMPGFPKCATSWLYSCLSHTWHPRRLGCGGNPRDWTAAKCKKRFALMALSSNTKSEPRARKETFFFGGTIVNFFNRDMLELHGPDPRGGPLKDLPALWLWEDNDYRMKEARQREATRRGPKLHRSKVDRATHSLQMDRMRAMCSLPTVAKACTTTANTTAMVRERVEVCEKRDKSWEPRCSSHGVGRNRAKWRVLPRAGPNYCVHPGCDRIARGMPNSWSGTCGWSDELSNSYNRSDVFCLRSATPWAAEGELNLSMVDFTPNYLCDADAVQRIYQSAVDPAKLRFIVVMRDPVMRAFSEWSMFALGWGWDGTKNFTESITKKVRKLSTCNESLWQNVSLLRDLPTAELRQYLKGCFERGKAMMYVATSMYAVCLLHALRYFKREQFLFLRYEDLMQMDSDSVVKLLARFTGLHVDAETLGAARQSGKCQATNARKPMSFSSSSAYASEMLSEASPHLERLFDPYNHLLAEIVHPSFVWHTKDHYKRPLNATEKEKHLRREVEAEERKKKAKEKHKVYEQKLKQSSASWVKGEDMKRREQDERENAECKRNFEKRASVQWCLRHDSSVARCNASRIKARPCVWLPSQKCRVSPLNFPAFCGRVHGL